MRAARVEGWVDIPLVVPPRPRLVPAESETLTADGMS